MLILQLGAVFGALLIPILIVYATTREAPPVTGGSLYDKEIDEPI